MATRQPPVVTLTVLHLKIGVYGASQRWGPWHSILGVDAQAAEPISGQTLENGWMDDRQQKRLKKQIHANKSVGLVQHWSELVGVERLVELHSGNWTPNRLKRIGGGGGWCGAYGSRSSAGYQQRFWTALEARNRIFKWIMKPKRSRQSRMSSCHRRSCSD